MTKKRFENVMELNYVEDLQKALAVVADLSFNAIRKVNMTSKTSRTAGTTRTWGNKPFIGLRKDHEPIVGFRCRSESLADRVLEELQIIMAEKNPVVDEPMFTPQVTYHDVEPDWETRYTDLVKALIDASNSVFSLGKLLHQLKRDHPELVEEVNHENED